MMQQQTYENNTNFNWISEIWRIEMITYCKYICI